MLPLQGNCLSCLFTIGWEKSDVKSVGYRGRHEYNLIVVGTTSGVYVFRRDASGPSFWAFRSLHHLFMSISLRLDPRNVFQLGHVKFLQALTDCNKLLVCSDLGLRAYSLSHLIDAALNESASQSLNASSETLSPQGEKVVHVQVERTQLDSVFKVMGKTSSAIFS